MWAVVVAEGPGHTCCMGPYEMRGMYNNTWLWTLEFMPVFWVRAR